MSPKGLQFARKTVGTGGKSEVGKVLGCSINSPCSCPVPMMVNYYFNEKPMKRRDASSKVGRHIYVDLDFRVVYNVAVFSFLRVESIIPSVLNNQVSLSVLLLKSPKPVCPSISPPPTIFVKFYLF